jgi:acyl-CoA thioesterase-1
MRTFYALSALIIFALGIYFFFFYSASTVAQKTNSPPRTTPTQNTLPVEDTYTIVAFGDSLTAGLGVSLSESYPAQLETLLKEKYPNIRVINMGVSGETTSGGLDRVDFVLQQKPSLVLLGLGANDMLRGTPPLTTKQNLSTIITRFKEADVAVVLLGMQSASSNGTTFTKDFDALYPALARTFNIPLVPFFLDGVALVPTLNTADVIHPNKAGYAYIIEKNILPIITPLLDAVIQK